jgi:hypothetical protein
LSGSEKQVFYVLFRLPVTYADGISFSFKIVANSVVCVRPNCSRFSWMWFARFSIVYNEVSAMRQLLSKFARSPLGRMTKRTSTARREYELQIRFSEDLAIVTWPRGCRFGGCHAFLMGNDDSVVEVMDGNGRV